jgi:hypothetical protein
VSHPFANFIDRKKKIMRKSLVACATKKVAALVVRPAPPLMPEQAQILWKQITACYAADHFAPAHIPLLEAYCRASVTMAEANHALDTYGLFDHECKPNPALAVRDKQAGLICNLATKLRLAHSSTYTADSKKVRPNPASYKPWL